MKLHCHHADTCLPDFWSGHHLPHVGIMALPSMSFKDVREAILREVMDGAVIGSTDDAQILGGTVRFHKDEARAEKLERAIRAAINRDIKPAKKGARRAFPNLEAPGEDCDAYVMAYFVFVIEE